MRKKGGGRSLGSRKDLKRNLEPTNFVWSHFLKKLKTEITTQKKEVAVFTVSPASGL